MHYIAIKEFNKAKKLAEKWIRYKKLRRIPHKCLHGHPDFQTAIQRENILDSLIDLILDIEE